MTGVETVLLHIERDALATERARLTAAVDLLALINEELVAAQELVDSSAAIISGGS